MNIKKEQEQQAQKIMKDFNIKSIFMNVKGEFFTTENLANLSVGGKKEDFVEIKSNLVKDEGSGTDLTVDEVNEKLRSTEDVRSLDYNTEIKPFVNVLKLETDNDKKNTLIKALEAYKANLK